MVPSQSIGTCAKEILRVALANLGERHTCDYKLHESFVENCGVERFRFVQHSVRPGSGDK
jgi:hypothetical protein